MSFNTFGKIFRFTTWGESHGPAIGCVVDGCPPNIPLSIKDIQKDMDRRRPGKSKFTSQRKESDKVEVLSGVFQGRTTGTPISMIIYNQDAKSRDYETIKNKFRPGHADYTYFKKYGIRDFRGGGRQFIKVAAKASSGNFTYLKALIPQGMRIDEIRGLVVGNDPDFKALRLIEFSQSSNGRRFTGSQKPPDHYKSHGHGCFILLVNTLC